MVGYPFGECEILSCDVGRDAARPAASPSSASGAQLGAAAWWSGSRNGIPADLWPTLCAVSGGQKLINGSSRLFLKNLGVPLVRYAVFWSAVWLVQWSLAPTWLVGSRSGLSTLLQALPGAIVGLLALTFASFYVLGQQSANVYGSRAVTVLIVDPQVFRGPGAGGRPSGCERS